MMRRITNLVPHRPAAGDGWWDYLLEVFVDSCLCCGTDQTGLLHVGLLGSFGVREQLERYPRCRPSKTTKDKE
jgi:hypothetical protein